MTHKFKIWDKQEQKWFTPTYEAHRGELSELFLSPSGHLLWRKIENGVQSLYDKTTFQDRFEIVWGTGLKDKNGVEGYIGDIAKDEDGNAFEIRDDYTFLAHLQTIVFEVIGNIYENKELLND